MAVRSRNGLHDLNLASRKAEESALRRYQAAEWLECLVGPLGIPNQPSEREFISSLRNGLILCNAINKINPGAVPRVVDNQLPLQTLNRESQPLPAYQYFENVRNFLVAVEELKLPAFEASNLERDALEAGSAAKVVDCILALKQYQESTQIGSANAINSHIKSPPVLQSANKMLSRAVAEVQPSLEGGLEELIAKQLTDYMVEAKENLKGHPAASVRNRYQDPVVLFSWVLSNCLGEELQEKFPQRVVLSQKQLLSLLKDSPNETTRSSERFRACVSKDTCNYQHLSRMHEKEIMDLKDLLTKTKKEFEELQCHIQRDLNDFGRQVQELSAAALGYHKVVKENRNLYNMVQDLRGNIRVYCRIKPPFSTESRNVIDFIGEDGSLVILDPLKSQKERKKVFKFNQVFGPPASQDTVFKDTQPLIRSVMDGYNVCIFAYGQTGSGKTYTMSGPSSGSSKDMGINYLALNDLFQLSDQRKDTIKYDIFVQMVEIYNEQVRDLLAEEASNKLEIRSCYDSGTNLPDATLLPVKSTLDVLNLMKLGEVNRAVSSTAMNNKSSRSHSVLTVHVHGKDFSGSTLRSRLHLVDLAGSERVDKSEVTGERLKEAQYINKSLSCLGDVIRALAQKNSHIPYRNSKLTLLLQDSLGGHAKTLMFAHVSPEEDSFSETISTLKFAQRVSTVELGVACLNQHSTSSEVMQLREQVESLRMELAKKEAQKTELNREPPILTEKAPLPLRRLSSGNSSTTRTDKSKNPEARSATKSPSLQRRRRLSREGSKQVKKSSSLPNVSADQGATSQFEPVPMPQYCPDEDAEAVSELHNPISSCNSEIELHDNAPQSPTSFTYPKRPSEVGIGTEIPPLKPPQTPETSGLSSNDMLRVDSQTPNSISKTDRDGSQARKSTQRSGKLITDPEKRRRQQNTVEEKSSIQGASHLDDGKSSNTASTRAGRRRSIIGVPSPASSVPDMPRRSSLGGKPTVNSNEKDSYERTPTIRSASKPPSRPWL